ncbi:hypothetical protein PITCH_A720024 [uncultured Desulfobacterium sp.]|uniref:Uncharacterized protein n=1 Tax=uncultured Desulfobacterium sp. TaxID=201089 RepID=A0A445N1V4_9BACT|nr:hypothetical protein PITCH_A720024 [uncultured Desulfobacterium sp.]
MGGGWPTLSVLPYLLGKSTADPGHFITNIKNNLDYEESGVRFLGERISDLVHLFSNQALSMPSPGQSSFETKKRTKTGGGGGSRTLKDAMTISDEE